MRDPLKQPFPGRPVRLGMVSLMLPSHDLFLRMDGTSESGLFKEMDESSLYKRLNNVIQSARSADEDDGQIQPSSQVMRRLANDFRQLTKGANFSSPTSDVLGALEGDPQSMAKMDAVGLWEFSAAVFEGAGQKWWAAGARHCAEVEAESLQACAHVERKNFSALVAEIRDNSVLAPYFTRSAQKWLSNAESEGDVLVARGAAMCEFLLAQVARMSQVTEVHQASKGAAWPFDYLLEPGARQQMNPGAQFFGWFKQGIGNPSVEGVLELAGSNGTDVLDLSTLKRWNRGEEFPREESILTLAEAIYQHQEGEDGKTQRLQEVASHFYVARRMYKLMRVVNWIVSNEEKRCRSQHFLHLLEEGSIEIWMRARYAHWVAHWQSVGNS
jgi:hypothetical protein